MNERTVCWPALAFALFLSCSHSAGAFSPTLPLIRVAPFVHPQVLLWRAPTVWPQRQSIPMYWSTSPSLKSKSLPSAQLRSWKNSNRGEIPPNIHPPPLKPSFSPRTTRATAVYALMVCQLAVFLADHVFRVPLIRRHLYLFHHRSWKWWQPLTTCFCHADRTHLGNNLFLLLLFGRSVEDDLGPSGLLWSFAFTGVVASYASLLLLPSATVSIGASGAVFGLFAVSTLTKLSWRQLLFDWRKLVEVAVLGEFVFRQVPSEVSIAARGGRAGVNHIAHLSGAAAGVGMVLGMRSVVARYEKPS